MKIISAKEHRLLLILATVIFALFLAQLLPEIINSISDYLMTQRNAAVGISISNCYPQAGIPIPRFFILLILPLIYKAKTYFYATILTSVSFISYYFELTHPTNRAVGLLGYSICVLTSILFFWQLSIIFRLIAGHTQNDVLLK